MIEKMELFETIAPPKKRLDRRLQVNMDQELYDRLKMAATQKHTSMSSLVVSILQQIIPNKVDLRVTIQN